jgi:hypothetical protein
MATTGTRVRDWATVDYYAMLGVAPNADADEVTRAFRALAKQLHPDAAPDDAASARFRDIAAAYAVLGDGRTRVEYDRVRAESLGPSRVRVAPSGRPAKPVPKPWSKRRAWVALSAGALVTLLGIGAAALTWSLHQHDARLRARFVPVTAARIESGNGTRIVSFTTRSGERIRTEEPQRHGDPSGLGPTVAIRYDPDDPEHVITGASTAARDITFAIVALKLLIGGPVFMAFGYRRLRRAVQRQDSSSSAPA